MRATKFNGTTNGVSLLSYDLVKGEDEGGSSRENACSLRNGPCRQAHGDRVVNIQGGGCSGGETRELTKRAGMTALDC